MTTADPKPVNNETRYQCCPLCASPDIARHGVIRYSSPILFSTHQVSLEKTPELWSCSRCKSGFTQNVVQENVAKVLYAYGFGSERWVNKPIEKSKHHEILEVLDTFFTENRNVLDIGCNTGELLDYAKEKRCRTSGVEFALQSRKVITEKGHSPYPDLESVPGVYDVITAFDLVEHLYNVPAFFCECKKRLSKDGRIILLTGDIFSLGARLAGPRWWYICYPEHIVFPSKKYFMEFSGLKLERWIPTYASLGYDQSFLRSMYGLLCGIVKRGYTALPSPGPDHVLVILKNA